MKTKLLKKLRKKYSNRYTIARYSNGWAVYKKGYDSSEPYETHRDLCGAKQSVEYYIRCDILKHIILKRKNGKRTHAFNHYPW